MVIDILPGSTGSSSQNLTMVGANVFFTAQDVSSGRELWMTNGTPEGTHRVRDITPGPTSTTFGPYQQRCVVLGNRLIFVATSDVFGVEIWSSDGTESGTAIIKDVYPGAGSSQSEFLTVLNGALYFAATGADGTRTLWRSDGAIVGAQRLVSGSSVPVNPEALHVIDGLLYFSATDQAAATGRELWISDGTVDGTHFLQDLNPGSTNSNPTGMIKSGNRMYLSAYKPGAGVELWSAQLADPTPASTPTPTPASTPTPTLTRIYVPLAQR